MWWSSGRVMEEQCWWKSDGGTVWWNSVVEEWNSVAEQWNSDGETVWWNSGTVMVEQCGGTLEQ